MGIPTVEKMEIYPVAGHDCMELNLSGAHAPYFTRNIVILTDSNGVEGVGEVPGGEKITKALEDVMDARTPRIAKAPGECLQAIEGYDRPAEVAYPIVYGGDVSGTVLLLQGEDGAVPDEAQIRLIQVGAAFLGRQME